MTDLVTLVKLLLSNLHNYITKKMNRRKIYIILTITALLLATLFYIFITTNYLIPERKEIENPKQLASKIVNIISTTIAPNDTLFLVTEKQYSICGTGMSSPSRFSVKFRRLKEVLKNPYYINNETAFKSIYNGKNIKIIPGITDTGGEGCGCFSSQYARFTINDTTIKKLYTLTLSMRKNNVTVLVQDFDQLKIFIQFDLELINGTWQQTGI